MYIDTEHRLFPDIDRDSIQVYVWGLQFKYMASAGWVALPWAEIRVITYDQDEEPYDFTAPDVWQYLADMIKAKY